MKKIVLLATDCEATRILFHALQVEFPIHAVVVEKSISRKKFLERRIKKLGWWKVVGQIAFQTLVLPYLKKKGKKRLEAIKQSYQLSDKPIPNKLIQNVPSVNHHSTRNLLKTLAPDLVIVSGTRIIGKKTLNTLFAPFINMHVGITPTYRGVHGGYWALANQQPEYCGVTIHLVDKGIDTGGILRQSIVKVTNKDNFSTYPLLQVAAGIPLMKEVIQQLIQNQPLVKQKSIATTSLSKLWSHPTIWEYWRNGIS